MKTNPYIRLIKLFLPALILLICLTLFYPQAAHSQVAELVVTSSADNGPGTLRQAVADAPPGATIKFDFDTSPTITLDQQIVIDKDLTIDQLLPVASEDNNFNYFNDLPPDFDPNVDSLVFVTLTGGGSDDVLLMIDEATVNIKGIWFKEATGAAIGISSNSQVTIEDSTFENNGLGGIINAGKLIIDRSYFYKNQSIGNALFNLEDATADVKRSLFDDNRSFYGGAIQNKGTLTVDTSFFSNNAAALDGGGIYNDGALKIINSTFSNNSAFDGDGGGLYTYHASPVSSFILNSTFVDNSASNGNGGGIAVEGGQLGIAQSTVAKNSAEFGGGIFSNTAIGATTVVTAIGNSIIADNGLGQDCFSPDDTISADNSNIDSDGQCDNASQHTVAEIGLASSLTDFFSEDNSFLVCKSGVMRIIAYFGFAELCIPTLALTSNSVAIDNPNVDDSVCRATTVNSVHPDTGNDQRGFRRDENCDIGAFEYIPHRVYIPIVVR